MIQIGYARKLSDLEPETLLSWFQQLDQLGSADIIISDGVSMAYFHGSQSAANLVYTRLQPPDSERFFDSDIMSLKLTDPKDIYHTALLVSSSPFSQGNWQALQPGQLIIARRSAIVWSNKSYDCMNGQIITSAPAMPAHMPMQSEPAQLPPRSSDQCVIHQSVVNTRSKTHTHDGKPLQYRLFDIGHMTHYRYESPVEYSTHVFRLQPSEDHIQEVVSAVLNLSCEGEEIQYEDVFGNQSIHYSIESPYTELIIESKSRVKVFACPPDDYSLSRRRTSIPLLWMPWQRQMMMTYLLPSELPETQLIELTDYAMSFVERNDYHLLNTLEDINQTIYHDYQYIQDITLLTTTPFKVYSTRQGVCQDFANLFICLARLLGIPARYRMGYIYTGANYDNKIQSQASHAWVEVYLPYIGWRGFDPTNGCSVSQDHVRIACGRNYRDATPTSGTLFRGGGGESLIVNVEMEEVLAPV
ncbi:MAG: transglutaminase [Gammaproteobacteria bacterium]|nr:transglutaminase [Gammaproteobacteria bacterium]